MMRTIRIVPTVILAAAVLQTAGNVRAFTRDPAPVFVNELHYDNTGVDQNEAVEIAGPAETDLTGWRLILYNGSDGADYFTRELSGWRWVTRFWILMSTPPITLRRRASKGRRCERRCTASSTATPVTATAPSGRSSRRRMRIPPIRAT